MAVSCARDAPPVRADYIPPGCPSGPAWPVDLPHPLQVNVGLPLLVSQHAPLESLEFFIPPSFGGGGPDRRYAKLASAGVKQVADSAQMRLCFGRRFLQEFDELALHVR
jgi:hypothetical protein